MSKPIALLAYQEADIEKQQIEADLKTTENRIKMNKRAKFIKQQQATLQQKRHPQKRAMQLPQQRAKHRLQANLNK